MKKFRPKLNPNYGSLQQMLARADEVMYGETGQKMRALKKPAGGLNKAKSD